jgi:hypothetical protein
VVNTLAFQEMAQIFQRNVAGLFKEVENQQEGNESIILYETVILLYG